VAAPDQIRIVVDRWGGSDPGHSELIVIGSDMYSRIGAGPWRKDSAVGLLTAIPHWLPEALVGDIVQPVGEAKFIHLWQKDKDGGWKVTRVISFDHHPLTQ
jgi:hypothetical protein